MVDAGVSLLESASRYLVEEKLRSMEQGLDEKFTSFNKTSIRWRRGNLFILSECSISFLNHTQGGHYSLKLLESDLLLENDSWKTGK